MILAFCLIVPATRLRWRIRRRFPCSWSIFGIGVDHPTMALVAFLYGKAAPSEAPQDTVLPKL
jgi:hypothetical protein